MAKPLHERLRGLLPDKVREKIPEKWQPPAWRAPVYAPSPWAGEDLEWNPGDPAEVPLGAYALGDAKGREIEHYIPPGTKGKVVAVAEGFVVFSDGQAGYQLLKSDVRSLVPKKERKWAAAGGEHKFPRLSESARSALEIYIFDPVHAEFGDVFPGRLEGSTLYVTKGQEDRAADLLDAASNSAYDDKDTKLVNALVTLYTKVRRAPRTAEARKADLLPGGQGDDMPDDAFDEVELEMGIEDELEHTSDPDVAKEIAKDHLVGDPSYYSKMGQYESVVYHGSREPDIEALEGGMPPYAGGIGAGVYVAFDPEVAAFYGPYVYELRLHVPPGEILWLTPDTIDYRLGELLPNSILVGEQVLPFSFNIGEQKYSVVADEREALEAIAAREMRNALREAGGEWEAFREHFEASSRWLDADDAFEYLADGFAEQGFDVETAEAKAREMAEWYRGLEKRVFDSAEKQLGLAIDLSEIGGEAAAAGYRAVYLEGVRAGGSVDSELLVFDPADLEMLGQTRTAAGLPAVGDAAKKFAAEVKQGIDQVRGAEYELRPGLFPDKESIEKMLNDVSDVIVSGRGRVPLTSYLDLDLVRSEEARARLKRIGTFVVVDGRTNHGGWFSPSAQLIGINVSPHELTYNSSWQIWQRIKTTFEHEVRHAIDWAYNPDAFVAANPGEESTGTAPKTRRWWTRYLNQPTELMAWAGNIAAALAIRPSSWERLKWSLDDYKVWVEKEGSVRVLDLVKEENKKRLLQMILKAYDQANPPGEKGPNKWQIMKSDLLAKRKIPESFVASLLPFVYGAQKREGMASEPTWQEWVKNRSTDQIVMEAENNYAVYKILRALPKNALDEYPPLAPMIDDWRQKHGLPYTMRPETADAWSTWERAS